MSGHHRTLAWLAGIAALLLLLWMNADNGRPPPAAAAPAPPPPIIGMGLDAQLARAAQPSAKGRRTVFVGAALYGSEGVFERDIRLMKQTLAAAFGDDFRAVLLSNQAQSAGPEALPTAAPDNLSATLQALRSTDRAGDIYVLLLTTHGSQGSLAMQHGADASDSDSLSAEQLGQWLDILGDAPVWVMISACYSGSLLPSLDRPNVMTMTAANADQPSFGCGDDSANTWFVKELSDSLRRGGSWDAVWTATRDQVLSRERAEAFKPSDPQWQVGERWRSVLAKDWRSL